MLKKYSYFAGILKKSCCLLCLLAISMIGKTQLEGKRINIKNPQNQTYISMVVPGNDSLLTKKPLTLVFYALPNGNSIEWTMGKRMSTGDDWHFDIQHIAAQTRFIQSLQPQKEIIIIYLANELKSWPAWKKQQPDGPKEIRRIVDSIAGSYASRKPAIVLNGHSGGGSFIFGYLDAVNQIPDNITRIGFIDSDYGYEDSLHGRKLVQWLKQSSHHYLQVLAYNDSVVIYNGKPLVSPTGGTWYRSQLMQKKLATLFRFNSSSDTSFRRFSALHGRIAFFLKNNPEGKIYHTEQVARNGFIQTMLGGTAFDKRIYYTYWGDRVYNDFIL